MKNKKLLSLILIIILIFGVAPFFVGNMAKENIEKQAAQISQMPGYTLEIRNYDQGWFSSHATIFYSFDKHTLNILKDSKDLDQVFFDFFNKGLILDVTVTHGPVTFQNGINFSLLTLYGELQDIDHEAYRNFKAKANITSLANTFISVSYGGTTSIKVNSPPFKADYSDVAGKKLIINSAGIEMRGTINATLDEYGIEARMDKLVMELDDGIIVLDQMNIQSKGNKINDYLWTGNGTTAIGEFNITASNAVSFSLNNLTSDYDLSKESDEALALNFSLNMEKIITDEINLKNIELDFNLNHLDLDAVAYYVKSIKESYQPQNKETPTPEQMSANMQKIATHVGEKLIKGSPELIINNINFLMGEGYFKSTGKISFNGESLDTIEQLSDPIVLNNRLAAAVNIKFNKALAQALTAIGLKTQMTAGGVDVNNIPKEQFNQMVNIQASTALQAFATQGYIQFDGEEYSTHFDMRDGQRLINGKPLPIPGL